MENEKNDLFLSDINNKELQDMKLEYDKLRDNHKVKENYYCFLSIYLFNPL